MDTSYKIYAMILERRLRTEIEEKKILPETQAGFRKKRGCKGNIMALKWMASRKIGQKKKKKPFKFFADLKAAFDKVNREKLSVCMEKQGIDERQIRRLNGICRETKSKVRIEGRESRSFWTTKRLRQECPLSPLLFVAFIADVEEYLKARQEEGVVVGREKICTLTYADDLAIVADRREERRKC